MARKPGDHGTAGWGSELKLKVGVTPELVRLVCGLQGHAKVIEPEKLGEQVTAAGRRLAEG